MGTERLLVEASSLGLSRDTCPSSDERPCGIITKMLHMVTTTERDDRRLANWWRFFVAWPNLSTRWKIILLLGVLGVLLAVVVIQWVAMGWVHKRWSDPAHHALEVLFYGLVGPILMVLFVSRVFYRWHIEKTRAERDLAAIVNSSADAIISLDEREQIRSWNLGAEAIFGYRSAEVLGRSFTGSLVSADHRGRWEAFKAVAGVRRGELELQTRNGQRIPVEFASTPLYDKTGQFVGWSLVMRDITERKRYERLVAEERARIARDLHDGVQQDLALLGYKVDLCCQLVANDPERVARELQQIREALSDEIKELRRLVQALRPIDVERLGFLTAVRQLVTEFGKQHQVRAHFTVHGVEHPLNEALEVALFRILQETLTNVAKHAQARNVWVELDLRDTESLALRVEDDGRGFESESLRDGGLGLKHIRERLAQWGGQFTIDSNPGQGTKLSIWVPLPQHQTSHERL